MPKSRKSRPASGQGKKEPSYSSWLIKSEPESRLQNGVEMKFSLDDLKSEPNGTACWDGVRNYSARNWMRAMKVGQRAFFYHSNIKVPGIIGLVKIVREAYPDYTQFDPKDPHYDPRSKKESPSWDMVDVEYVRHIQNYIPLPKLKELHLKHKAAGKGPLKDLSLFTKARLSVMPLSEEEFEFILGLEKESHKY